MWCLLTFLLTSCCNPLNNYMVFNDTDGLYTYTFEAEKKVTLDSSLFSITSVMQGKLNSGEDILFIFLSPGSGYIII